jgi:hypothetical protein
VRRCPRSRRRWPQCRRWTRRRRPSCRFLWRKSSAPEREGFPVGRAVLLRRRRGRGRRPPESRLPGAELFDPGHLVHVVLQPILWRISIYTKRHVDEVARRPSKNFNNSDFKLPAASCRFVLSVAESRSDIHIHDVCTSDIKLNKKFITVPSKTYFRNCQMIFVLQVFS